MSSPRVWLITGVSSGLGLALALHVTAQGDKVVGTVRSLSKFPEELKQAGVVPIIADFTASDEVLRKAGQDAINVLGKVDVLVNNAAYGIVSPVEEQDMQDLRMQFQTNVFGLLAFAQPLIAHLRERRTGHILNISSYLGMIPIPSWGTYGATKAALNLLSDVLHTELKLFGVRVLTLSLGYFASNFMSRVANYNSVSDGQPLALSKIYTDPWTHGYDLARQQHKIHVDMNRVGDPEKYAVRVYELVTGTGLAKGLTAQYTEGKWEGPWEFNQVLFGTDTFEALKGRLTLVEENRVAFEKVTVSTDVEKERLHSI
ncbi:hypothetical protein EIP86_007860 [Pleurotus ostreatoroseus]|nr:hypothetical protein EIP86_007860 [Pleurotus ostreatoroseus]